MRPLPATAAVARGTVLDVVRRPGFALGLLALGALLAVVPRIGSPAAGLRENAQLALELSLATILLAGALVGGLLGARSAQIGAAGGVTPELVASPLPLRAVLAGRFLGCVCAVWLLLLGSASLGALGWIGSTVPRLPDLGAAWSAVLGGTGVGVALAAAVGVTYGAIAAPELAALLTVAHVIGARLLIDAAPAERWVGDAVRALPDPRTLDVAHAFAFAEPVLPGVVAWSLLAAAAQIVALLCLAPALLRIRIARRAV